MKFSKRELNAGDLSALQNMSNDELVAVIVMLNNERKDLQATITKLLKSKRELMFKAGCYTWQELLETYK